MRGASLVEAVLALALLGLTIALGLLQLHGAPSRASVRGAAEVVAEEFRYARSRAVAHGTPVALVLPGGSPVTRAVYHLEGFERPRVVRVKRLEADFPSSWLFSGTWPLAKGSSGGGGPLSNRGGFSLASWGLSSSERAYVFLPSGVVVSDQPAFDGAFHILVCDGLRVSNEVEGRSFRLEATSTAATVRVTFAGDVSVERGVLGADSLGTVSRAPPDFLPAQPPGEPGSRPATWTATP